MTDLAEVRKRLREWAEGGDITPLPYPRDVRALLDATEPGTGWIAPWNVPALVSWGPWRNRTWDDFRDAYLKEQEKKP